MVKEGVPMAARSIWKGHIKLAELAFPVALYAAATTSKRISFHILNRKTGNRVHREYVDEETEKPVEKEQQVKGYETGKDEYIILDSGEIAQAVPDSDKTLKIEAFIPCREVESVYFDKPYFIAPTSETFSDSFAVVREGMRKKKVAALARAVLFRRVRTVMLRAQGPGLVAHTLNFDYEVRSGSEVFADLPELKIEGEMLDLAKHIIDTKKGKFHPSDFDDRYDKAVAELVKAKIEGREIKAPKPPKKTKVTNLLDALRESAKASGKKKPPAPSKKKASSTEKTAEPARRRKAG
jgi:DNA end-binding protein Ku